MVLRSTKNNTQTMDHHTKHKAPKSHAGRSNSTTKASVHRLNPIGLDSSREGVIQLIDISERQSRSKEEGTFVATSPSEPAKTKRGNIRIVLSTYTLYQVYLW
jgi:hypothetical protein